MILLLRVIDKRCDIDLPSGTIVVPIEDRFNHISFMTPDEKIVRIRGVSIVEIMIDRVNIKSNPFRSIPEPTRELWIFSDGMKSWYKNGQLHRDAQPGQSPGPAIERADGTKMWFKNGQRHRDDGPAVEWAHGTREWYKNNQLHRNDGPALERADGSKSWFKNGQHHRDDGPAIEYTDGTKMWYKNGQRHRDDGPAVE